jgi:hypothetical protein
MTTYREELEAWLREPLPSDPRERAQEEATRALVKGGLEGALSWTQVYHAMNVVEDEASARRLDQVERMYDALRQAEEHQEAELEGRDGPPRPELSEEERVVREARGESDYRMSMELHEAHEAEERGLEMDR